MSTFSALGTNVCTVGGTVFSWSSFWNILRSGDIYYRREINRAGGYFILWYSSDAGGAWEELMNLDLTEESVIIDSTHQYVHSIVGTAYQVATTGGEVLYST